MNMDKKDWINDVMNSLDSIKPAEADPFLYTKVISKINSKKTDYIPMKIVWLAAASFALLIAVNFMLIKPVKSMSQNSVKDVKDLAKGFQLLNENSINYNQ